MSISIQICARCVMDTSDSEIVFDEDGICNHCTDYLKQRARLPSGPELERRLDDLVAEMKAAGRGKPYDCIVGVSGGVDSTYVAYVAKQLGLRPLAVHLDNGWNSELAVDNIHNALNTLGIDLHTHVLDWQTFRKLQVSFLRASVSDGELPTDHAIRATLWDAAAKHNIKYILNGRNHTTEGILPWSWTYSGLDWRYIRGIHNRFENSSLRLYPHVNVARLIWGTGIMRITNIGILDYVPFTKQRAMNVLTEKLKWRDYGGKHYESVYTRFFQGYILPHKFGIDKRKAHLSVLVASGQISRQEALEKLQEPPLPRQTEKDDRELVLDKLELTQEQFVKIIETPPRTYRDYPNNAWLFKMHENAGMVALLKTVRRLGFLPQGFGDGVIGAAAARRAMQQNKFSWMTDQGNS